MKTDVEVEEHEHNFNKLHITFNVEEGLEGETALNYYNERSSTYYEIMDDVRHEAMKLSFVRLTIPQLFENKKGERIIKTIVSGHNEIHEFTNLNGVINDMEAQLRANEIHNALDKSGYSL